jgi:hypothetical protein
VFLAKPAFKASFVAGYCLRPQGQRNGPFQKPAKRDSLLVIYTPKCSKRWLFSQKMDF